MKKTEQTKGYSVLDHGLSVKNYTFDLINHLKYNTPLKFDWILPDWVYTNKELILSNLPDDKIVKYYTILHDCGKSYCLEIDSDGKKHFKDHAEVSADVFSKLFNCKITEHLIRRDMDIHLLKADEVEQFCKDPFALTLLLVGLAETHSNAAMFGGTKSESFKIKLKKINQRGKKIIKNYESII
jgi:hypothetical protein